MIPGHGDHGGPPMAPDRVLPRHLDDQRLDRGPGRGPSWPSPAGAGPLAGHEVTVPAHDRGRGDREDLRPPAAARQPRQRRKPDPASMIPPQPAAELAAQHLVLAAQHQQLHVPGQARADQHRQQAGQAPHQPVEQRRQHPEMVPATLPIPQQTPAHTTRPSFRAGQGGPRQVSLTGSPRTASPARPGAATWPGSVGPGDWPSSPGSSLGRR